MITTRDCWELSRQLDDRIDAALQWLGGPNDARARVRLERLRKAQDFLDTMERYVEGDDAVIRLDSATSTTLVDFGIEVPDRKPVVIWLSNTDTYKLNAAIHAERGAAISRGDEQASEERTLELQELWQSRHKDRASHFSSWSVVAVAAARHGFIEQSQVYDGPWDRIKVPGA